MCPSGGLRGDEEVGQSNKYVKYTICQKCLEKKLVLGKEHRECQKEEEWLPAQRARWGLESRDEE